MSGFRIHARYLLLLTWTALMMTDIALTKKSAVTDDSGTEPSPGDPSFENIPRERVRRHDPGLQQETMGTDASWGPPCNLQCFGDVSANEMKRNYRMDSVREDILRKLRMQTPPNITGRIPEIPAMQTLLTHMNNNTLDPSTSGMEVTDLDHITPLTLISLSHSVPQERRSNIGSSCYFNFSPDLQAEQVITAQLGVYIRERNTFQASQRGPSNSGQVTWILIYRISRSNNRSYEKQLFRKRKIALTPADTGKWHFFEARSMVEYWLRQPDSNLGIQILAADLNGVPLVVLPSDENQDVLRPYIEIQIRSRPSIRPRRSTDMDCAENSSERRCCRYPLTIDFDAFQWDWVIAPKRYDAYYCSGECPFLYYTQIAHTHLWSQTSGGASGVPCCSPAIMSPLQMLYMDNNLNIVYGTLPGMVVERCGCS